MAQKQMSCIIIIILVSKVSFMIQFNLLAYNFIQKTMEDKCQTAATKDTEIQRLRTALRERDGDIERVKQMLLNTEGMIDVSKGLCNVKKNSKKLGYSSLPPTHPHPIFLETHH